MTSSPSSGKSNSNSGNSSKSSLTIPSRYFDPNQKGWCAPHWIAFHAEADAFPQHPTDIDKQRVCDYFELKSHFIPCQTCGEHFRQILQNYPVRCNSGLELSQWVVDAHNMVNQRCGHSVMQLEQANEIQHFNRSINWTAVGRDLGSGKLRHEDDSQGND